MKSARLVHYRVALVSSVFIATSAVTGLLWAYAPYLYWEPGYKEKRSGKLAPLRPEAVQVGVQDLPQLLGADQLLTVTLRTEAGTQVYDVRLADPARRMLVDAQSGEILSPLSRERAILWAAQYADTGVPVAEAVSAAPWEDRKHLRFEQAWIIRFQDPAETEVVLDARSGEILEHSDRVRRFHFWVMKLHQFNFFGTHKVLSAVSGVPLLALLVTGVVLGARRLRPRRRA